MPEVCHSAGEILASIKMQPLLGIKKNSLCLIEASASKQEEIESIDGQLSRLTARAAELKDRIENLAVPREKNKAEGETDFTEGKPDQPLNGFSSLVEASLPSTLTAPEFPAALTVFYIGAPPPFPGKTKKTCMHHTFFFAYGKVPTQQVACECCEVSMCC